MILGYLIWSSKARQILQQEGKMTLNFKTDVEVYFDPMNVHHFRIDSANAEEIDDFFAGIRGVNTNIKIGTVISFLEYKFNTKMTIKTESTLISRIPLLKV